MEGNPTVGTRKESIASNQPEGTESPSTGGVRRGQEKKIGTSQETGASEGKEKCIG
jgi:hypothetical protein